MWHKLDLSFPITTQYHCFACWLLIKMHFGNKQSTIIILNRAASATKKWMNEWMSEWLEFTDRPTYSVNSDKTSCQTRSHYQDVLVIVDDDSIGQCRKKCYFSFHFISVLFCFVSNAHTFMWRNSFLEFSIGFEHLPKGGGGEMVTCFLHLCALVFAKRHHTPHDDNHGWTNKQCLFSFSLYSIVSVLRFAFLFLADPSISSRSLTIKENYSWWFQTCLSNSGIMLFTLSHSLSLDLDIEQKNKQSLAKTCKTMGTIQKPYEKHNQLQHVDYLVCHQQCVNVHPIQKLLVKEIYMHTQSMDSSTKIA